MKWFTILANSTSRSCLYDRQDSDITSINHLTEDSQSTSSSLPTIMSPSQRCLAFGYGLSVTSLTPLTMILLHWVSVYHNPHHPSIFFLNVVSSNARFMSNVRHQPPYLVLEPPYPHLSPEPLPPRDL